MNTFEDKLSEHKLPTLTPNDPQKFEGAFLSPANGTLEKLKGKSKRMSRSTKKKQKTQLTVPHSSQVGFLLFLKKHIRIALTIVPTSGTANAKTTHQIHAIR